MCGITGVFTRHSSAAAAETDAVVGMTGMMRRRGPDDEGFWRDERVSLGFRRLSIIDLSDRGHQPMESADGRIVLVFNGELYNHVELRRELEAAGRRFRSTSDTEVVLEALAAWGRDALRRFNGMFALAWYDRPRRSLSLARDPLGIKPLYYMTDKRGIVFGSQFDQLLSHPWSHGRQIERASLDLYLQLGYVPAPYGLVAGTSLLPAGHVLEVSGERTGPPIAYWRFPDPAARLLQGDEAVDLVEDVIERAVARQMRADVPVGTFLSGGVDSPLVCAAMAKLTSDPIRTFTIGSNDEKYDESGDALEFAEALRTTHRALLLDGDSMIELLDDVVSAYGEPFADHSAIPTFMVAALAREDVKVVLSGDGGDELFWGYNRFVMMLRSRRLFRLPRVARSAAYVAGKAAPALRPREGVLLPTMGDWFRTAHSAFKPHELASIAPGSTGFPPGFEQFGQPDISSDAALAQWLRREEVGGFLQRVLLKVDRASMHHGLEVRVPLLDLEVVEAAAAIDPAASVGHGRGKLVLRAALSKAYPTVDTTKPKRGFSVPMRTWLHTTLRPAFEDLVLGRDPFPGGTFDRTAIRALYDADARGEVNRTQGLWNLLALQLWAERHVHRSLSV